MLRRSCTPASQGSLASMKYSNSLLLETLITHGTLYSRLIRASFSRGQDGTGCCPEVKSSQNETGVSSSGAPTTIADNMDSAAKTHFMGDIHSCPPFVEPEPVYLQAQF